MVFDQLLSGFISGSLTAGGLIAGAALANHFSQVDRGGWMFVGMILGGFAVMIIWAVIGEGRWRP